MPMVSVNDCATYYEIDDYTDPWATGTETVWLQHGVGRSSRFWYHWVPALARHYRVLRRDMRGHGRSADPGPGHQWSIDELITDMRAFMDAIGLERVHYVGESIGGILGVAFAARWPERLKSLTICNSPTAIRRTGEQALSGRHGTVQNALATEGAKGWGQLLIEQKIISGKNPAHVEWVLNEWAKTPTHVLQGITRTLDGADIAPVLPQITVPALILAPSRSPITPLSDQVTMRTLIPDARIAVIEGPGHEIYVDEPEECINAYLKFIGSLN